MTFLASRKVTVNPTVKDSKKSWRKTTAKPTSEEKEIVDDELGTDMLRKKRYESILFVCMGLIKRS